VLDYPVYWLGNELVDVLNNIMRPTPFRGPMTMDQNNTYLIWKENIIKLAYIASKRRKNDPNNAPIHNLWGSPRFWMPRRLHRL